MSMAAPWTAHRLIVHRPTLLVQLTIMQVLNGSCADHSQLCSTQHKPHLELMLGHSVCSSRHRDSSLRSEPAGELDSSSRRTAAHRPAKGHCGSASPTNSWLQCRNRDVLQSTGHCTAAKVNLAQVEK